MPSVAVLLAVVAGGCAHAPSPPPACVAPPTAPPIYVAPAAQSLACERDARPLLSVDRREAWEWLKACVRAGRFIELRSLLDGEWDALLRHQPDAPSLLLRIVAERGGDVDRDLALLRERRIPLFTLAQALADPDLYRGRLVVARARVASRSPRRIVLEPTVVVAARAVTFDVESGTRLVAHTTTPDPFLAPDDVIVLLARFEALAPDGDDGGATAQLTLVDWQRPRQSSP